MQTFPSSGLLLLIVLPLTACLVDVQLDDKACSAEHSCAPGFVCSDQVCLTEQDAVGRPGGPCTTGGGCDPGLTCLTDRCVEIPGVDAGNADAGPFDAGDADAGDADAGDVDAGDVDAGDVDAGGVDAGDRDAGPDDSGAPDSGPLDGGIEGGDGGATGGHDAGPDGGCGVGCGLCTAAAELSLDSVTSGSNDTGVNLYGASCNEGTGDEQVFRFTAPAADRYSFRVAPLSGDAPDHTIAVFDGCDDGSAELACSSERPYESEAVGVDLSLGQTVAVVVDANYMEDVGPFELEVASETQMCGQADVGLGDLSGNTADGHALFRSTCSGGEHHPAAGHRFVARTTDLYSFTASSAFDLELSLFDGCDSATELDCSSRSTQGVERVVAQLVEGQEVVVSASAYYAGEIGPYDLSIRSTESACDDATLATADTSVIGNTENGSGLFGGSCVLGDGQGDKLWRFVAPATDEYEMSLQGSPDVALIVTGACAGEELVCLDQAASGGTERAGLVLEQDAEILISAHDVYAEEFGDVTLGIRSRTSVCTTAPPLRCRLVDQQQHRQWTVSLCEHVRQLARAASRFRELHGAGQRHLQLPRLLTRRLHLWPVFALHQHR